MTVKELISALKKFDKDADVLIDLDYCSYSDIAKVRLYDLSLNSNVMLIAKDEICLKGDNHE